MNRGATINPMCLICGRPVHITAKNEIDDLWFCEECEKMLHEDREHYEEIKTIENGAITE